MSWRDDEYIVNYFGFKRTELLAIQSDSQGDLLKVKPQLNKKFA